MSTPESSRGHALHEDLTSAVAWYWTLDRLDREGKDAMKGSSHIVCDELLCRYLAEFELAVDEEYVDIRVVRDAFMDLPVKQVFHVVRGTVLKIPDLIERDLMLRRYAKRKAERNSGRIQRQRGEALRG